MAERVDRSVVAELVVEVDAEDRHVHREHATGVVGHDQCATRREGVQAMHLRPVVGLQDWTQHTYQALG
ncbi:Uncharacterised protein [Mycobacterium tuberculosis]|uniref:Uncharacterized protein n=1 Tax=Mycobacterium tuberculosis TaxID=1773 RepID=A0A916LB10_MYCTX|nr:Uncharacterised protein [Mycobacterium tuberculosis]COX34715.1 Uncharacterised protein [Mycobacterium tuberculosis]COY16986.1 Uncharacterised protein [Mycobacterium tuberculosis]